MPVGTSVTSLPMTGATLPADVQENPPHQDTPKITIFFVLGSAEPGSSRMTNFSRQVTNLRVLGSPKPRIPWHAHSLDRQIRCACWNLPKITPDD